MSVSYKNPDFTQIPLSCPTSGPDFDEAVWSRNFEAETGSAPEAMTTPMSGPEVHARWQGKRSACRACAG